MTLSTLEYIWIDGQEPVQKLRSKTKVAKLPALVELSTFKKWNYDGSSTNQSEGGASDLILSPVSFCKDIFYSDYLPKCRYREAKKELSIFNTSLI